MNKNLKNAAKSLVGILSAFLLVSVMAACAPAPASAVRFSASEKWDQGYGAYAVGETLRHAWIDVRTGEPAASVAQTALIAPGGSALTVSWQLLQTLFAVPSSSP